MQIAGDHKDGAVVVFCHNQLQKAIHEDYLAKFEDAHLGLAKKLPKEIFDHFISQYAKITIPMQLTIARSSSSQWAPTNHLQYTSNAKKNA